MSDADLLALYGTTERPPDTRSLVAGHLSCVLSDGALRDIRWRGTEILRGVAYLLRDREWGTVPAWVEDLAIEAGPETFLATFTLVMQGPPGRIEAAARIEGRAEGRLTFDVAATPDDEIVTNRCGFVVLHPADVAGLPLRVETTAGSVERTVFPSTISPSQPVFDIRALDYEAAPGLSVRCRLDAALPGRPTAPFEMEDQRNWSDASFKTYVGSLLDPWPYWLRAGERLTQRVALAVDDSRTAAVVRQTNPGPVRIGLPGEVRMPAIGIGVPPGLHRARPDEVEALRTLGASWWMAEVSLDDAEVAADLGAAALARTSRSVRVQLDVICPDRCPPDEAAAWAASLCRDAGLAVDAIRLLPASYLKSFQPSGPWPDLPPLAAYALALRRSFPDAKVGGGMFTFFTELNRHRPAATGLDFIGHSTCPIVHDASDEAVMQTTEALPHILHSVGAIWPNLPYRLGPSTIAARRNPYGDEPAANPTRSRIALAQADPRHEAAFGAAWTVAYAAAIAPLGLDVLSLHASHGASGPYGTGRDIVPAWNILSLLAKAADAPILPLRALPPHVAALAWARKANAELIIANLRQEKCKISIELASGKKCEPVELLLGGFDVRLLRFALP